MKFGRIIATAAVGLLFMLFVSLDLVLFGVVPLNSALVTVLPLLGLVIGGVLGGFTGARLQKQSPSAGSAK
jgi:uncharacterized membrane protein YfcA